MLLCAAGMGIGGEAWGDRYNVGLRGRVVIRVLGWFVVGLLDPVGSSNRVACKPPLPPIISSYFEK
ncbi:hypothetical protein L484_006364 [Morus notabilis]|uniref:Uncharacterized protein n=1 Tax=Morus notabilis TaxID=981085 RepID=W9S0G5_9ROSA|nr:hypothetical protein L484_006364 [Morus notabilis]